LQTATAGELGGAPPRFFLRGEQMAPVHGVALAAAAAAGSGLFVGRWGRICHDIGVTLRCNPIACVRVVAATHISCELDSLV
jgi:hypothetical protein